VALFADDLFLGRPQRNDDVALGLDRFVMVGDTATVQKAPDQIVVLNWFTELRARLRASSLAP
jgi:hypothetical protein